jgi:hypothetical protein
MSLMQLMSHGLHALPVLQVNARVSIDALLLLHVILSCLVQLQEL